MKRSRNINGPSEPYSRNSSQASTGDMSKDGKRKRKTLGDRTNFSAQDVLQHSKKRKQVGLGEDKENIPPQDANLLSFIAEKQKTLSKEVKPVEYQPVFSFDLLRCKKNGHLFVLEYVLSMARALVWNEKKSLDLLPNPHYFLKQTNIRPRMRTILFSWMTEVHLQFELKEVVLWASFQICDRFLSKVNVHREKLQLVGCASI